MDMHRLENAHFHSKKGYNLHEQIWEAGSYGLDVLAFKMPTNSTGLPSSHIGHSSCLELKEGGQVLSRQS